MTDVWHYIWPQPEKWRRSPRGFILYPFSPHRLALFSFSHSPTQSAIQISSSVQPSVSIPIPDRPTGHAQVACPSCREWQTANIPQWTGFSCLIPIAAFFFFSQVGRAASGPRSLCAALGGPGESCGSEPRPTLSITFNICLSGTFNLFYSTTSLDSTDLPHPWESNEMAVLMSASVLFGKIKPPSGGLQEKWLLTKQNTKDTRLKFCGDVVKFQSAS